MKLLRETIRRLILEGFQKRTSKPQPRPRFEKLLVLLNSNELDTVNQGIELAIALGIAKVVKHIVFEGYFGDQKGVGHNFYLKFDGEFFWWWSHLDSQSQGENVSEAINDRGNYMTRTLRIKARDPMEKWDDYKDTPGAINLGKAWWDKKLELPV